MGAQVCLRGLGSRLCMHCNPPALLVACLHILRCRPPAPPSRQALKWRDQQGRRVYGWYARGKKAAVDIARGLHYLVG